LVRESGCEILPLFWHRGCSNTENEQGGVIEKNVPDGPEWERAQPIYANCTEKRIQMLYQLRDNIRIAFVSTLGPTRIPKEATGCVKKTG
jgi:hypothetical protein